MIKIVFGLFPIFLAATFMSPEGAIAQEKLHVAVAANFTRPFKELAAIYEAKKGIKVESAFTSSGSLYNQIINGAPYDLFLSADEKRPLLLEKNGLAEKPFVYALGQVVLWSARKDFCEAENWKKALRGCEQNIAMANPKTAPYGLAAMTALERADLWTSLESKIVIAQSVAQSFHYASTEAASAGFCALSGALSDDGSKGCFFAMEEAPPIIQAACVLKKTKNPKAANDFAQFLVSDEAKQVKERFGYR
ncbi:MAG: molybdate ABC transporter substrate-binding protein [Deltaproteobacteria bacterium]|nr:molybdate ABC transporter substrate-binding protein [Deltaproteobacteria bacterium]